MTDVWVHNLDPFIIQFTESFGIRWYSMAYLSGFAIGYMIAVWMSKKGKTPLTPEQLSDFATYNILGVLLGGRLGYALFYSPELLTDFRADFPFWGAMAVWEGGMASHGGFLGVIIACLLFAYRHKFDQFHLGDLTIIGAMCGITFGRIANFINGELMGRVVESNVAWAVKFPQDIYRWIGYDQAKLPKLAPVVNELGISSQQWAEWVQVGARKQLWAATDQIIAAVQNGNAAVTQALGQVLDPRHPSQLYASALEGFIPLLITLFIWRKPRKPGIVSGVYLIVYSIARVFDEMFRLPDAHLSDLSQLPLGLTRGQFLSLFFFIAGVGLILWCRRRDVPEIGGLNEEK